MYFFGYCPNSLLYILLSFKEDIRYLTPMFVQLKEPEVLKPAYPIEIEIKDYNGKSVLVVSKFKEIMFQ